MTKRHRNRRRNFSEDVERRERQERFGEALEIVSEADLELVMSDYNENKQRPAENNIEIGSRREQSQQGLKALKQRKRHYCCNKRRERPEKIAHVLVNEGIGFFNYPLCNEVAAAPDAGIQPVRKEQAKRRY